MDEEKKTGLIAVIIVLVVFGSIGIVAYKMVNKDKYTYTSPSGEEFWVRKLPIGGYALTININNNLHELNFRNDPKSVKDIPIDKGIRDLILDKNVLYVTVDPELSVNSTMGVNGLFTSLRSFDLPNFRVDDGTTKFFRNSTKIITCENVTKTTTVLWLRLGQETKVFSEDGCIIVQGTEEWEIVKATDRLTYQLLTLMD